MNLSSFSKALITGVPKIKRGTPQYRFLVGALTAVFFSVVFTIRLLPAPWNDRAVFISVAEYLRSGSRLYVDIYDNKDPLFFYAVAAQRVFGPLGEYFFELLMVAIAAIAARSISQTLSPNHKTHQKLLLIAVPLLLTGTFWEPGMTHLPGTAISLLALSFFLKDRLLLAGGCMGLVALTKLIMLPLPAAFCLTYELSLWTKRASYKRILSIAAGFFAIFGMMMLFLLVKQDLAGYLQAQKNNFFYSQSVLVDNSSFGHSFASHLRTMLSGSPEKLALLISFTVGMMLSWRTAIQTRTHKNTRAFLLSTLSTGAVSIAVLGLTGIWDHHLQLLYFVQTLVVVGAVASLRAKKHFANVFFGAVVVIVAVLLSGTLSLRQYDGAAMETIYKVPYIVKTSPEIEAFRTFYPAGTGFARLGQNTTVMPYGAANDELLCPDFVQYPFYSSERLQGILNCVTSAPTLIVDYSFERLEEAPDWWPRESQKQVMMDSWNKFVAEGESLIKERYTCKQTEYVRICDAMK